jgi:hypothetical protein
VNNEVKACRDEIALDLEHSTHAKLVVVGESDSTETAETAKLETFAAKHKKLRSRTMLLSAQSTPRNAR